MNNVQLINTEDLLLLLEKDKHKQKLFKAPHNKIIFGMLNKMATMTVPMFPLNHYYLQI